MLSPKISSKGSTTSIITPARTAGLRRSNIAILMNHTTR
jgi:hypothetical protein